MSLRDVTRRSGDVTNCEISARQVLNRLNLEKFVFVNKKPKCYCLAFENNASLHSFRAGLRDIMHEQ